MQNKKYIEYKSHVDPCSRSVIGKDKGNGSASKAGFTVLLMECSFVHFIHCSGLTLSALRSSEGSSLWCGMLSVWELLVSTGMTNEICGSGTFE